MSPVHRLSIAAPVYNEQDIIASVVGDWLDALKGIDAEAEIVLCNDGSSDNTSAILGDLAQKHETVRVVDNPRNMGYGAALSNAISACRGDYIVTIDSDGQFSLSDLEEFLRVLDSQHCDGVVGYRVKKSDSPLRVFADRALNTIVRIMFGTRLRDTNCALKLVKAELLQGLTLESTGFSFPTEVCLKLEATGASLFEAPISHSDRTAGESKLRVFSTGTRMFAYLIYLRIKLALFRRRIINRI